MIEQDKARAVEGRAREMLQDLVGNSYSDTTLRIATDWLKQEHRLACANTAQGEGQTAGSGLTLKQRAHRIKNNAFGAWWNGLTDAERRMYVRSPSSAKEDAFLAGVLAALSPEEAPKQGAQIAGEAAIVRARAALVIDADNAAAFDPSEVVVSFGDAVKHLLAFAQPASQMADRDALVAAYKQGATDVHNYWVENPGEPPQGDPEFCEAASDYAASALDPFDSAARTPPSIADRREEIARTWCDATWGEHGEGWEDASEAQRDEFRKGADAVIALLSPASDQGGAGGAS